MQLPRIALMLGLGPESGDAAAVVDVKLEVRGDGAPLDPMALHQV